MSPISLRTALQNLEGHDLVLGLCLLGAGLVFMILGVRIYKVLVAISFGFVGLAFGCSLPMDMIIQLMVGLVGAAALVLVSSYFVKLAVAILAGGWSALVTMELALHLQANEQVTLVLAALAFAAAVSRTFVLYQEISAAVTSFEGTLLFVGGLVIFLSHYHGVWGYFRARILATPVFMGFILLAGAVIGFYGQVAEMQKKQVGTSG